VAGSLNIAISAFGRIISGISKNGVSIGSDKATLASRGSFWNNVMRGLQAGGGRWTWANMNMGICMVCYVLESAGGSATYM
jgi:hypothetical protein